MDRERNQTGLESTAGEPSAAWIGWVREQWNAVRVAHVATTQLADVGDRVRVRAVIHLGPLSPADVCVEVVKGAGPTAGGSGRTLNELWSTQSYRNGTFVFEGVTLTDAMDDDEGLTVRVRPRKADEKLSDLGTAARCPSRPATDGGEQQ